MKVGSTLIPKTGGYYLRRGAEFLTCDGYCDEQRDLVTFKHVHLCHLVLVWPLFLLLCFPMVLVTAITVIIMIML